MQWSIQKKMVAFAMVMIVLPVAILGLLSYSVSEKMLIERLKESSRLMMESTAHYFVQQYIDTTEKKLIMLSKDPRLLKEQLTDEDIQSLMKEWEEYRKDTDYIWYIYYGTEKGEIYLAPRWNPPADYDPRIRPWYTDAVVSPEDIVWSQPYVEVVANHTVVTATRKITADGKLLGVFAIDTSLDKLSDIIKSIPLGTGGYAMILDRNGNIIAANEFAKLGRNMQQTDWFQKLTRSADKTVYCNVDGRNMFVSAVDISHTGWTMVGFLPLTAFEDEVMPIKQKTLEVGAWGVIFAIVLSIVVSNGFSRRIRRLAMYMARVEGGDYTIQSLDTATDELGELNYRFNRMVATLRELMEQRDKKESEIRRQQAYFAQLFQNSPESIVILDTNDCVVTVNQKFEHAFQYKEKEIRGRLLNDLILSDEIREEGERYSHQLKDKLTIEAETVRCRKDGSLVDVHLIAYPIYVDEAVVGFYVIYRDIAARKDAESRLHYLSFHDALTGVYNRVYFEQQLQLAAQQDRSAGVFLIDVDGLKLINDSMGHASGDQLLREAAAILQSAIPDGSILARIGGDEFVVLLPGADEAALVAVYNTLQLQMEEYNSRGLPFTVSMSAGYALAEDGIGLQEALKEADNRMYKEKLHRSQSTRSALVKTLMHALHGRDFITEGHAERMEEMVERLALRAGIPAMRIPDLRLFAQFHDIGKVGVPDAILFKPGRLNDKEMEIMRRHSEIGYRIATASPELTHIADWILKHHEWWNGKGYPIGLFYTDIPLECRILAICDAYDAMINDRPYRKALSKAQAVEELTRNSGIMFDPVLVEEFLSILAEED